MSPEWLPISRHPDLENSGLLMLDDRVAAHSKEGLDVVAQRLLEV